MRIKVKVTPNSKRQSIELQKDLLTGEEIYAVKLLSPPQHGKANQELIMLLSEYFTVPKRHIKLLHGHTARRKVVELLDSV